MTELFQTTTFKKNLLYTLCCD